MSDTITIRVPEDVKALMKATDINWSEDIRGYIEARIKALKLSKVLKGIVPGSKRKGSEDSSDIIREWRDAR